jgi:predicted nucleic acid-binding protein
MISRVIVDTSVWSLALRRRKRQLSARQRTMAIELRDMIVDGRAILLGIVRQELLTGIKDQNAFEALQNYLHEFDDFAPESDDYERAAAFSNQCQSNGIAVSTVDMLLCSVAAGRNLPLFTADRDFEIYRRHLPIHLHSSA